MRSENQQTSLRCSGQFLALTALSVCMTMCLFSEAVWAQDAKQNSDDSPATTTVSKDGGKVIEFKQLKLEGTVQRPSAAYLMQRRRLKFKGIVPKKSFISKIKESISKPPF